MLFFLQKSGFFYDFMLFFFLAKWLYDPCICLLFGQVKFYINLVVFYGKLLHVFFFKFVSVGCQTALSLPNNFDLEKLLGMIILFNNNLIFLTI